MTTIAKMASELLTWGPKAMELGRTSESYRQLHRVAEDARAASYAAGAMFAAAVDWAIATEEAGDQKRTECWQRAAAALSPLLELDAATANVAGGAVADEHHPFE